MSCRSCQCRYPAFKSSAPCTGAAVYHCCVCGAYIIAFIPFRQAFFIVVLRIISHAKSMPIAICQFGAFLCTVHTIFWQLPIFCQVYSAQSSLLHAQESAPEEPLEVPHDLPSSPQRVRQLPAPALERDHPGCAAGSSEASTAEAELPIQTVPAQPAEQGSAAAAPPPAGPAAGAAWGKHVLSLATADASRHSSAAEKPSLVPARAAARSGDCETRAAQRVPQLTSMQPSPSPSASGSLTSGAAQVPCSGAASPESSAALGRDAQPRPQQGRELVARPPGVPSGACSQLHGAIDECALGYQA
jgi:hypothetical protein